jgi:uncharacterized protein with GYD domain
MLPPLRRVVNSRALLKAGSLGNVRSETLRGFPVDEVKRMIGNIP